MKHFIFQNIRRNKIFQITIALVIFAAAATAQNNRQLTQDEAANIGQRTALVIGNGEYANARKLANPPNDAADMAKTLSELGFDVIAGTNLNLRQMNEKVREFGDKLKANGGVGLFYYAGHGIQANGKNYLIPIEADITREDEINFTALNFDGVLQKMATANNGLNIVILDACRNNPFARSWSRDVGTGGLAQVSAPTGTFIAYATSPDKTASDGEGRNGLYTAQLLKFIKQPNLKIEETFKEVRKAVNQASSGKQVPWDSSSLSGDFYFKPANAKFPTTNNKISLTENSAKAGAIRKNKVGMELAYIPAGEFMMGSTALEVQEVTRIAEIKDKPDFFFREKPQHQVRIAEGFWMGRTEVTQAQWQSVMGNNPSALTECGKNCPVDSVSWFDAQEFIKRLNAKNDGFIYSLPSEAEWEYAARAGTTTNFAFGNTVTVNQLNVIGDYPYTTAASQKIPKPLENQRNMTIAVAHYPANAWGLYDMHGNVSEWCEDLFYLDYAELPADGSANTKLGDGRTRVLRGGSWQTFAYMARSAARMSAPADYKYHGYGFRVAARLK